MLVSGPHHRFVHLHLHTEYSLLDGGNKISRLVERVKELGMNAVAMTDHGNLYGAVEFYSKARASDIKPILGIEAYVAVGDRREKKQTGIADGGFHLVLLAENNIGWANLVKLSSDAYRNGFYYKPRMDRETLAKWSEGLIAINGHLGSSIAHHLLQFVQTNNRAHYEAAKDEARWHEETFRPNASGEPTFYIEIQRHSVQEQQRINPHLVELARELKLPLVCDNDAHFLRAEDYEAHDSLCCISMQKTKQDSSRLRYSRDLYVKSPQEMCEAFADIPEAIENTLKIADRCNVELDFSASHAPVVKVTRTGNAGNSGYPGSPSRPAAVATDQIDKNPPSGSESRGTVGTTEWFIEFCSQFKVEPFDSQSDEETPDDLAAQCDSALRSLCRAGRIWRYGNRPDVDDEIDERLEREIQILSDKRITAYFLIVWDLVNWARQRGIPAMARGSGVGTMVGYVLGLSNACPVKYGLLFERFTDPDRSEYPDIDIDICQDGRAAVLNYVREKYGYVAQIITFGRLKAKAAIKDVARVNGLTPSEGQRLANLVPGELNITIESALAKEPEFRAEYENNPQVRDIIDTARALEDHARHAGIHAAGVVVATQPLENIVPLGKATGSDDIVTQWDGPTCEKVGLLKMDFLGLRTLSTIELARTLIRETLDEPSIWKAVERQGEFSRPENDPSCGPHPLDLERLSYDDQRVFALFRRADTSGIFQFESGGMRKLLLDMKPDRLEDLIAANALFRPGPMDLIPEYCLRKHGKQPVPRVHDIVDQYTAETYGIMVYQEQVMQIVHGLGDIPLREAYSLIKAISKKKESVINAVRPRFIEGAGAKGLSERNANELFDLILKFAGYGFNKSHSTGYAIIAYQTAYLKTYFPAQYMAATLTYESGAKKVDDWAPYLVDCRQTVYPDHTETKPHVGVEVKPPDLNRCRADFSVVFSDDEPHDNLHGHIRFGLGAIKGVGKNAIGGVIEERDRGGPFRSIFDFCERVPSRIANKATIEALVRSGAFDVVHGQSKRAALLAAIDDAISAGHQRAEDRRNGQMSIFGSSDDADALSSETELPGGAGGRALPNVPAWDQMTMLAAEKDTLGIHVSGHPLDFHRATLQRFTTCTCKRALDLAHDSRVIVGGMLSSVRQTFTKTGRNPGQRMAMITLQDQLASLDGVVFAETFARDAHVIQDGAIVLLIGAIDTARGGVQIKVEQVIAIDDAPLYLAGELELTFVDESAGSGVESEMQMAAGLLQQAHAARSAARGKAVDVTVRVVTDGKHIALKSNRIKVVAEPVLLKRLHEVVGTDHVRIVAAGVPPIPRRPNGNYNGNGSHRNRV